jgi:phage N-6-adenine-methyltransferase
MIATEQLPAAWTSDDWLTPPNLLKRLGVFDLDPCASSVMPWATANHQFTLRDDGLKQEWFGRVWLNPPYSKVTPWTTKMAQHGNGMMLVNAWTEAGWFFESIWNRAHAVLFFNNRLCFFRPDGSSPNSGRARMGQVIAAYTFADAEMLYQAQFDGKFIPLVLKFAHQVKTTWAALIRFLIRECGGIASLEELYALAQGHPKTTNNPHWKAKIRQQVQKESKRIGPALYQLRLA